MEPPEVSKEDQEARALLRELVQPWYDSLSDPGKSQESTLQALLKGYSKTEYGVNSKADRIGSIEEYQRSFPISSYHTLQPYLDQVKNGRYSQLLSEPVSRWVMTRGTTGDSKVIPATETHLSQILSNGSRAIINFALRRDIEVMKKNVLNLNFPSEVRSMVAPDGEVTRYGYSSGTYAKLFPSLDTTSLVPRQEEIDSLGGGITRGDWERRFELVYEVARESNIGSVMGVTQVIEEFASWMRKRHHTLPKRIWRMNALFCTSVAKIQSKHAPTLRHYYGTSPIVEMYTATEGVFAQQLDENPYVCPNYDTHLFEVRMRSGKVKMLHELRPKEWGRIIISSTLFPRYDIGDVVESLGGGYFRVIGRASKYTTLEHLFYNALTGRSFSWN